MKPWILTEEERETLIAMAVGEEPEEWGRYSRALARIETGGLGGWNGDAALMGGDWLCYHKMFLFFWILMLLRVALCMALAFLCGLCEKWIGSDAVGFILLGAFFLGWFIFMGVFGNRLLFWALRRKLRQGYLKLPHYKATEGFFQWKVRPWDCYLQEWTGHLRRRYLRRYFCGPILLVFIILVFILGAGEILDTVKSCLTSLPVAEGVVFCLIVLAGGIIFALSLWKGIMAPIWDSYRVWRLRRGERRVGW